MTNTELPRATDRGEEKVLADVKTFGRHLIHVTPDSTTPGWSYTIGLHQTFGHPELILFG